ncbi:MAG: GGDEF domain-containing protein [bacterium]
MDINRFTGDESNGLALASILLRAEEDAAKNKELQEEIADLQKRLDLDAFTGLLNKQAFNRELGRRVDISITTGEPVALAFLDIDFFKQVNDTLGHDIGDELILALSTRLRDGDAYVIGPTVLHSTDPAGSRQGRLGGDEFGVLASLTQRDQDRDTNNTPLSPEQRFEGFKSHILKLCQEFIGAHPEIKKMVPGFDISVGFASSTGIEGTATSEALVRAADQDMYKAKGRNKANPS